MSGGAGALGRTPGRIGPGGSTARRGARSLAPRRRGPTRADTPRPAGSTPARPARAARSRTRAEPGRAAQGPRRGAEGVAAGSLAADASRSGGSVKVRRSHAGYRAERWPARSSRATHSASPSVASQRSAAGRRYGTASSGSVPDATPGAPSGSCQVRKVNQPVAIICGRWTALSAQKPGGAARSRWPERSGSTSPTRRASAIQNAAGWGSGAMASVTAPASTGSSSTRSRSRL